jgi:glycosyltransferase involved in cell wall biosynthesis
MNFQGSFQGTENMKIAHFISLFPRKNEEIEVYGAANEAYNLCYKLSQRGHEIQVFVPYRENSIEEYKNMAVHFYDSLLKYRSVYISPKLLFEPIKYNADIVHIHNDTSISVISGLRYAKKKGVPVVLTLHGSWVLQDDIVKKFLIFISKKLIFNKSLSHSSRIILHTQRDLDDLKFLHKYRNKVTIIPSGINIEEFDTKITKNESRRILGIPEDVHVVLFLSALYPLKGPHILIRAIPRIIKKVKNTIFVFVGGGDIDRYKRLSEKFNVQKYVRFEGYVKKKLKPLYYKSADVFTFPITGFLRGLGIVNLEAMASGLPIVASNFTGIPDVVKSGENGLLVPPGDPNSLADSIIFLLENEAVRVRMGSRGKEIVRKYTWDNIVKEYEKVYGEVLRDASGL